MSAGQLVVGRVVADDAHFLTMEFAKSDDETFTLDPETADRFYFVVFVSPDGDGGAAPSPPPWERG